MKKSYLLLLFSLLQFVSFGQMSPEELNKFISSASEQELLTECSSMIQEYYYYNAEKITDKLLTIQPESSNYNYRKGYLVLNSRQDFLTALPYFEKAILKVSKNYDMYSTNEKSAPPDAYYHIGVCYHMNEDLVKAKEYYSLFTKASLKKSELIVQAELRNVQCDVAKKEIENSKSVIVKNVGSVVNSKMAEYSPVISLDGSSLYFTSRRPWADNSSDAYRDPKLNNYPEDIYVSYMDSDKSWTSPEKLDFCNNQTNEASISVSGDEKRIYIYQDISGGGDIYYSDFAENVFNKVRPLDYRGVNSKDWETHCTVTPDGQNMYFVSDRAGGYGGRDIYRVVKLPNGIWSDPQNLGPEINTPYDEDSPFIAVDNKTLYFASNGINSIGGFDIFVSFRDDLNNWSVPVNMGYPINSTGDDIYYTTTFDGKRGYLSSFRKDGLGEKDIYEIRSDYYNTEGISIVQGEVFMTDSSAVSDDISVKIVCSNCENNDVIIPRMKNGKYYSLLARCKDYTVSFYDGGKLLAAHPITTLCNQESESIEQNHIIGKYTLAGTVVDTKTGKPLENAAVEFFDTKTKKLLGYYTTDAQGKYVANITNGKGYQDILEARVKVSSKDYISQERIYSETLGLNPNLTLDFNIKQLEVGDEIGVQLALKPIYFDVNKSNIRPDAALELDKIVDFMNENPTVVIELGSHTDCRATASYNKSLSNRRAISSANYIKSRITNGSRIAGKGYGESQLVNDCGCEGNVISDCSEEQHQANRRTEFKIIKK